MDFNFGDFIRGKTDVDVGKLFNQVGKGFDNWLRGQTGSGLTNAQIQQNQWQENMANTAVQRQVADMKAAGVNPALMYGSAPTGSATPSGATVSSPNLDISQLMAQLTLPLQMEKMRSDINKTKEETETERKRRDKMDKEISQIQQNIEESRSRTDLNDTQQSNLLTIGMYLDRLQDANLAYVQSQTNLNNSVKRRIDQLLAGEKILQAKSIEDFDRRWKKLEKEIEQIATQNDILAQDLVNYALNHASNGWLGTGLSLQNLLRVFVEANSGN